MTEIAIKLFDVHCNLQDPRILNKAPKLISTALDSGVLNFAVNGVHEKDWHLVKEMGEKYSSVIPCFGVHPWYVAQRSPNWFSTLKEFFETTPSAAVGEVNFFNVVLIRLSFINLTKIGLDKGSKGRETDFNDQVLTVSCYLDCHLFCTTYVYMLLDVTEESKKPAFSLVEVFRQQLELAKELKKRASVHYVRAYATTCISLILCINFLIDVGPFPDGLLLHSYLGSAEMVPEFVKSGAYFSFSGYIMTLKLQKAKKMLKTIPSERILLESDAPDAMPNSESSSLFLVDEDTSLRQEFFAQGRNSASNASIPSDNQSLTPREVSSLPKDMLNHPANIHNVLDYVANLLEISKEELAEISCRNAVQLFSYQGSKVALG
ncbi:Agamous-like MADS-box protein A [Hibiscus syriacus]|uniref:Agamous-like MADS-box protein A n=1 Tax=Hibiscus syriacus TaxID=106335 RepID=A0A6A3BZM8_HIBSY|nr:Agamous-like MADS-box protein A [Hibiscus syriacus]